MLAATVHSFVWLLCAILLQPAYGQSTTITVNDVKTSTVPVSSTPIKRPAYAFRGNSSLLFTCPDGRQGLHLIHARLMLNMIESRHAQGTFRASRMLLFRDFSLPSIARQTNQNFIFYVSYDHLQDFPFLEASHDILKLRMIHGASYMYLPEKSSSYTTKAHYMLDFDRVSGLLMQHGLASRQELDRVEIYITSRIDSDDAVTIQGVDMTQKEACGMLNGEQLQDRLLITHIEKKVFWLPSASSPYGAIANVPTKGISDHKLWRLRRAMRYRPILQSLAVHKSLMRCSIPLNCYTHYHFQPAFIQFARNESDCPFVFEWGRTNRILYPPRPSSSESPSPNKLRLGGLYSRTGGSWYADLNSQEYKYLNLNPEVFAECGIDLGEMSTVNMLLTYLYKEAPEAAKLDSRAAKGFGGIGYKATWHNIRQVMYKSNKAYKDAHDSVSEAGEDALLAFEQSVVSKLYGSSWAYLQEELNYTSIAAKIKAKYRVVPEKDKKKTMSR